ncbi:MFS general substrate transporter [Tothia fuscella]|uniref:MFS general substrate transporter n=1 Tax=Tothia fuscella TaxID=1048955 RepID=A0A9P4NV25_9PEZI|nr:MFS general substrate transporter [Tothia fuscella]
MTGMFWGSLSDRIGRKKVLLFGNAGTLLSMLIVGFAPSFGVALMGRVLGGLLNGNIGVIQTMVGELVTNPKHEPRAFAVMPFVWSIGTIIGPSIGGYFSDPADNFPSLFSRTGLFASFPYLLPNLLCALMLFGSIIAAYFFLGETHPDMQPWSTQADLDSTSAVTPLIPASGAMNNAHADLSTESYGTFDSVTITERTKPMVEPKGSRSSSPQRQKVFTKNVVMLVIALGIYTYHSMTYDHLMPIFFQDSRVTPASELSGGLGLSTQEVGIIMSVNGIIALFVQGLIFPFMASWLGIWKLFILVTVGHPLAYFVVPYLVILPQQYLYLGIYTCLFIRNFFSILAYPLLLIMIKEAAPSPQHLGKINGLAASTGGACRTIASPVAGMLYGMGMQIKFTPLAWWCSALVAVIGAAQVPWIDRQKNKKATVRTAVAWTESTKTPEEVKRREEARRKIVFFQKNKKAEPVVEVADMGGEDV